MRATKRTFFEKGQGIVEYIVITAMVAIAGIAILRVFREDLSKAYKLAGEAIVQGVKPPVSSDAGN